MNNDLNVSQWKAGASNWVETRHRTMRATMMRKAKQQSKPLRKKIENKRKVRKAARITKSAGTKAVKAAGEARPVEFEESVELVAIDLEPIMEEFEIYESSATMEDDV